MANHSELAQLSSREIVAKPVSYFAGILTDSLKKHGGDERADKVYLWALWMKIRAVDAAKKGEQEAAK